MPEYRLLNPKEMVRFGSSHYLAGTMWESDVLVALLRMIRSPPRTSDQGGGGMCSWYEVLPEWGLLNVALILHRKSYQACGV